MAKNATQARLAQQVGKDYAHGWRGNTTDNILPRQPRIDIRSVIRGIATPSVGINPISRCGFNCQKYLP
jgi:hypothetical protein